MKVTDESMPAVEATVWTILFSWMVIPLKPRRAAVEMSAAGMEVEKVSPAFRPKNTLAAVKTSVISTPRMIPRTVSSVGSAGVVLIRTPENVVVVAIVHQRGRIVYGIRCRCGLAALGLIRSFVVRGAERLRCRGRWA